MALKEKLEGKKRKKRGKRKGNMHAKHDVLVK
jgi:hypothetical protein